VNPEQGEDVSVLSRIEPHGWDPDTVAAYEVAVDLLNQVVGVHSARIRDAERTEPPDEQAVAALREEQAKYVDARRHLQPSDHEQVARIRWECAAIIREFDADSTHS
jgi:hypothetical protein